uniref:Hsp20/alpha crystallin family protein n=1 Tax=candidate division WOR-3 bacterium TaxID=2052148 RepID=A0A7C3N7V1_UNCW3
MKDDSFDSDNIDSLIDDFLGFSRVVSFRKTHLVPPADIYEVKDRFIIVVEIPGMEKKDISLTVSDDILILKGEKKRKTFLENDICYYHMEIEYGPFERRFRIPSNSDIDNMEVEYNNGFLRIEIPLIYKKIKKINIE